MGLRGHWHRPNNGCACPLARMHTPLSWTSWAYIGQTATTRQGGWVNRAVLVLAFGPMTVEGSDVDKTLRYSATPMAAAAVKNVRDQVHCPLCRISE